MRHMIYKLKNAEFGTSIMNVLEHGQVIASDAAVMQR